ncbi:MAG: cystathionine gamma-synthase [Armatimonadetes bacterium JP3_11]|jgi:cystathionine beta-lyase/cystathionine gamma-synthase|nr:MAG: cystathionine gamma-synthase [Armatimonadetes bacterium CP1_7O]OYT75100.1 MAG: cystathionine gamma-synthase [Armatimonadetes bacterium JP3_11]RMH09701.1 MAG: PLP-dependent transferase [Armatimonadota bacterium]
MHFETRAIREGQEPDPATGAIITPIYATTNFQRRSIDQHDGYSYSRVSNPTRAAAERCLASLENGNYALLFASGMAAEVALLGLLRPGDHVVCTRDVYGGTMSMWKHLAPQRGISVSYADMRSLAAVENALQPHTRMLWLESPTNPLTYVLDLPALAALGRRHDLLTVVDNTFATPYLQNPLEMGVDVVVHSVTKYLGGHSDILGGALVFNRADLWEPLWDQQAIGGAVLSPFESWLLLRGMKTLAVRMRAHCENAATIAQYLSQHPKVERVLYPGLPDHPQHALAQRQMRGFGGMIAVYLKTDRAGVERFCQRLRLFNLASSLGGVESLVGYPATMSHEGLTDAERAERGITDNLVRLSIGIEHVDDLIADLEQALARL